MSLDEVKGIHYIDNIETAWECQRWLSTCDEVAVDTEGTGLNTRIDKVRLLQFGDRQTAYCIPIDFPGWGAFGADMLKRFQGTFVAHNLTYDADMIRGTLGVSLPESRCHDTRLMSHVLESTGSTALKTLTRRLVDRRAGNFQHQLDDAMKAGGWNWATVPIDLEAYWMYGGLDTILTMQLKDELYPRVMAEAPKSYELELAVSWVARRMENKGVVVDREYTQALMDELSVYVEKAEKWCRDVHGVSPGANAKVIEKLQSFGVEFTKMTDGGQYSLDKEVLESIDHPLAATVLGRRRAQKMVSTYLENYLKMSEWDGKIHPSINTVGGTDKNPFEPGGGSGVRTGRMSMSDPNLQNVPIRTKFGRKIRNCFTASIDHQWAKADFSQIEMRVMAHMSRDPGLIAAFLAPGDFFVNMGVQLFKEPDFIKADPRRQLLKNGGYCVPVDNTEILTQRGWLKHNEVLVGDQTLGFDQVLGKTRWTNITEVHHFDDVEVVQLANKQKSFETTRQHRWLAQHEKTYKLDYITTEQQPRSPHRIILAAEAEIGDCHITEQEAAILGWVLSDGHIYRGTYVGAPSQAGGTKVACGVDITQVKPHRVCEIDKLLVDVPHRRYQRTRDGKEYSVWKLDPGWSRSLLSRVNIHDKRSFDPWQVALSLTSVQRKAMIATLNAGDGGSFKHDMIMITGANDSPVTELIIALGYLDGNFARVYTREPDGKGWGRNTCAVINYQKPRLTGQRTSLTSLGNKNVWCVTTELGTWTMRQDRTPVLTGNSKIYGAGIPKFAKTVGLPENEASQFMRDFDGMYERVPRWIKEIEAEGRTNLNTYGEAFVRSPITGRKHTADAGKLYTLVNYLIQGTAGEILKMKIVEADAAGLGPYMTIPVHDEIDLDIPNDEFDDVMTTLTDVMNDDKLLCVPITSSIGTGQRWGEVE